MLEKEWFFKDITAYRTVSIKRPGWIFSQKSLLNVWYDRKNEGLNILSNRSYNRMVRVLICALSKFHGLFRAPTYVNLFWWIMDVLLLLLFYKTQLIVIIQRQPFWVTHLNPNKSQQHILKKLNVASKQGRSIYNNIKNENRSKFGLLWFHIYDSFHVFKFLQKVLR